MQSTRQPSANKNKVSGFAHFAPQLLLLCLSLLLLPAVASAQNLVYVVTFQQQFGVLNLTTGSFQQIGPNTPEGQADLVWGPNGSLFSLTYSGNLESINSRTGQTTVIGATGLGYNAFELAEVGGKLYATDFGNNLYSINPQSGIGTLIRQTGMPPDPSIPFTQNSDGTLNLCDEAMFGFGGQLYAIFDAFTLDPSSLTVTPVIGADLYRVNPVTGAATLVGPTTMNLASSFALNGKFYAFHWVTTAFTDAGPQMVSELMSLNLQTGEATLLRAVDPAANGVLGAAPVHPVRW